MDYVGCPDAQEINFTGLVVPMDQIFVAQIPGRVGRDPNSIWSNRTESELLIDNPTVDAVYRPIQTDKHRQPNISFDVVEPIVLEYFSKQ